MPKLHPHNGVPERKRRVLPALASTVILLVATGLPVSLFSKTLLNQAFWPQTIEAMAQAPLSATDLYIYRDAFASEEKGEYDKANLSLAQVQNPLLKGVLTGERYLKADGGASFSDLALWLSRYGDHPQAQALYKRARVMAPGEADFITEPQKQVAKAEPAVLFEGSGTGQSASDLNEKKEWVAGLQDYRQGRMESARRRFLGLLKNGDNDLSSDDNSALAFWAYRAAQKQGDTDSALEYLSMAADEPPCFYSILAHQILNDPAVKRQLTPVMEDKVFLQKPGVRRAKALKSIGQTALAEKEIRMLLAAADENDRAQLASLAQSMGLPSAATPVAAAGNYDATSGNSHYPMPHWKPVVGYRIEPALLFAIMRKESGFNPYARSPSGAVGVMQLMPATAHAMAHDARMAPGTQPEVSMALGQHYLQRLMDISTIDDNLIYIIAAYNAGPGNVDKWQKRIHESNDPLLFVESIPNPTTRDYVVHVMGNYWVYSEMLGASGGSTVQAMAQNQWPHYLRTDKQTVAMVSRLGGELQ